MAFLVTTADQRFWKQDEEIIFLGQWCKRYQDRTVWEKLDHEVLPYHWEDRQRLVKDIEFIEHTYERYLAKLTDSLNQLHGVNFSKRYWRIVAGVWLRFFIDSLYDRYLSIKTAAASGKVTNTWIGDLSPSLPKKIMSVSWDDYNQYLFSRIIVLLKPFPYELKSIPRQATGQAEQYVKKESWWCRFTKELRRQFSKDWNTLLRQGLAVSLVELYPKLASKLSRKIIFVGSLYLLPWRQIKLQLGLGQLPYVYHGRKTYIQGSKPDIKQRQKIKLPVPENEFETVLNVLIPDEIPMLFVEDYQAMHNKALALSPKKPRAILTAYSINYRDIFHLWAAYSAEKYQTKLLLSQHGGGFGVAKHISLEQHFLKTFDRYYTWGSPMGSASNVQPMPSFRLSRMQKKLQRSSYNNVGQILMMATTMPRYKVYAESGVCGPHMLHYFSEQEQFLHQLLPEVHQLLMWRYFDDSHWDDCARMQDFLPNLRVQHGLKKQLGKESDFIGQVKQSRLAIHTANETTYLETLAANFPTIVFWNPSYYETRAELKGYFEALLKVGILHHDPISAAKKVNEVYQDPMSWWQQREVQEARKYFCDHLARVQDDWLPVWRGELKKMLQGEQHG